MIPFPITTFDATYNAFKQYYIARNGSNKFEKAYDIVTNSDKISRLLQLSVRDRVAPTTRDFLIDICAIPYFIFAKTETRALGTIIALHFWNERVNKTYRFASESDMADKIKSVFGQLSMLY